MSVTIDAFYDNVSAITDFANSLVVASPIWQSFTAGSAQYLYGVQLYVKTPDIIIGGEPISAVGVNIIIYNGTGIGGSVFCQLTSATVPAQAAGWYEFVFPSPFTTLTPASVYTIAVRGTGAADLLWGYSFNTPTSFYPGGTASFAPPSSLFFKVEIIPVPVNPNIPSTFNFVQVQNGTAGAPSYTFSNDLTTGLFLDTTTPAPNGVGITSGGVEVVSVNTNAITPAVTDVINLGRTTNRYNNFYLLGIGLQTMVQNGTDIPQLVGSGANPIMVYTSQTMNYFRIGLLVIFSGQITWANITLQGVGNIIIQATTAPFGIAATNQAMVDVILNSFAYTAGASVMGQLNPAPASVGPINFQLYSTTTAAPPATFLWGTELITAGGAGGISFSGSFIMTPPGGGPF